MATGNSERGERQFSAQSPGTGLVYRFPKRSVPLGRFSQVFSVMETVHSPLSFTAPALAKLRELHQRAAEAPRSVRLSPGHLGSQASPWKFQ